MTAINVIRQRDRILMFTDGACYSADGVLLALGAKVLPIVHMRAAIATRGSVIALPIYYLKLAMAFATFDEMVADGGRVVEAAYDENFHALTQSGESEVEIIIAGFSESRDQPETWVVSSCERGGLEPFVLTPAPAAIVAPGLDPSVIRARGFNSEADVLARFDPETDGVFYMEQQRLRPTNTTTGGDHGDRFIIGGFCQLTEITRRGISQRILKRWPDKIGEPIRPDRSLEIVGAEGHAERGIGDARPSGSLSRQQRRAAERAAQKRARVA